MLRSSINKVENQLSPAESLYKKVIDAKHSGISARPEWFYKGNGHTLKTTGMPLTQPKNASDVGEEAELVVVYLIDNMGTPRRIGYTIGNELSDHGLEAENHYYLAQSKLLECSIGSEIVLGEIPDLVKGNVQIIRDKKQIWSELFTTGLSKIVYEVDTIERFIFASKHFRCPGDIHYLYLGADVLSFQQGVKLSRGDHIKITSDSFRFALDNQLIGEME